VTSTIASSLRDRSIYPLTFSAYDNDVLELHVSHVRCEKLSLLATRYLFVWWLVHPSVTDRHALTVETTLYISYVYSTSDETAAVATLTCWAMHAVVVSIVCYSSRGLQSTQSRHRAIIVNMDWHHAMSVGLYGRRLRLTTLAERLRTNDSTNMTMNHKCTAVGPIQIAKYAG